MTDLVTRRRAYAEELRTVARLRSEALVEAFARVPREHFLGPGPWQIVVRASLDHVEYQATEDADPGRLYHNVLVAIDANRMLNNGQPAGLASWIDALDLKAGETAVHIGCGTGYYTAVLAEIVGSTGRVVAVEIDPELTDRACTNLAYLPHVEVHQGDGGEFNVGAADAIFVNAGATHPRSVWIDSLRPAGRLLLPITAAKNTDGIGVGGMVLITRGRAGLAARVVSPVAIFPCLGARDPDLNKLLSQKSGAEWLAIRSVRREAHDKDDTCWLQTPEGCLSSVPLASGSAAV
jgi:protein-L-isoaspartate(D-aspartate) O-methyltransferase